MQCRPRCRLLDEYCEDGYGDAFMMARWIEPVRQRVGSLRLRVKPGLVSLFTGQWPGVDVISWDDDLGEFDLYGLTYDLPAIFGVEQPEDVRAGPYLNALQPFRPLAGAFRVGIQWAGSPNHIDDLNRSTALEDWLLVLQVPGVTFYSLQLDDFVRSARRSQCPGDRSQLGAELVGPDSVSDDGAGPHHQRGHVLCPPGWSPRPAPLDSHSRVPGLALDVVAHRYPLVSQRSALAAASSWRLAQRPRDGRFRSSRCREWKGGLGWEYRSHRRAGGNHQVGTEALDGR
jgi:hypothetical protein